MSGKKLKPMVRLTKQQIEDKYNFVQSYIDAKNAASGSAVDANSNVTTKTVSTLGGEIFKDFAIQMNRYTIHKKICEMFSADLADEYIDLLERHIIYKHDETASVAGKPYCVAISMYPFLEHGLVPLGGESKAPKHLDSFCGSFINLVFAVASQFSGAVATPSLLIYFHYFAQKDYGKDYIKTHRDEVCGKFQHIVYSLNQPAASRDYQSVFHNMSVYDRYFYETMFGSFAFPDGTIIKYDDFAPLQELFLEWLLEERKKALLTFPVLTEASLNEGEQPKDMDFARMIANLRSRGLSMFSYNDSRASALASCCFGGDQKVLTNSSETGIVLRAIKDIVEGDYNTYRKNFTVFHNGAWCQAKAVKEQKRTMFEVETVNGKRLVVTDNHIHPTISGEKTTVQLTTDDYLMFNTMALDAIPERDEHLTYEQGLLIGLYAGDGSRYSRKNCDSKCVTFSLNTGKKSAAIEDIQSALDQWNVVESIHTHTKGKALAVNITSSRLFEITKKYVTGEYAHEKAFNLGNILSQNKEFRRGIIDGWYMSDGGNSNRIYSTSYDLIETGEAIMTSIGVISSIDTVDRRNEGVVINGETFNRNFKTHCIRWYDNKNKRSMANIFIVKNNSMFFKIKSIKQIDYEDEHVYCFEMKNENEPYFTLPNGIITHNCRLRNEFDENEFTTTLGSPSEQTGSTNVITINMHRVVYERLDIDELVRKVHKFHLAHRALVDEYVSAGLLPAYTAGYISTKKQFCTIGINGLNEAAEYLGHTCNNNEPYKKWLAETLSTFKRLNKKATKEYGVKFNSEVVPGESLGIKNANWDKKAGLQVNRDCYNSYFYLPDDNQISIIDKFILHGGEIAESCDGGQALHLNIAKLPDEEFFMWLRHLAAKYKTLYWTTNVMTSCCNGCGMNSLDTVDTCPHCGSEDISYATRVIGYCRKIENYSEGRKKEAATRFYH